MNQRGMCVLIAVAVWAAPRAMGQLPQPAAGSAARATQLPLSGRSGQSGGANSVVTPTPGVTTSVNTLNSSMQVQGPYTGSTGAPGGVLTGGSLRFRDAIRSALEYNLGKVSSANSIRQAQGQARVARSALLPNLTTSLREVVQQTNLAAMGVRIPIAPQVVGPFNYFDIRANLNQTLLDITARRNYQASQANTEAAELAMKDAEELVVYATAGLYLQALAAQARVASAQSQIETAQALLSQSEQRLSVGFAAQIDVNRARVQLQTQRQRLATLKNDLAKQKINLARLVGLPPTEEYGLADDVPFGAGPGMTPEEAATQAVQARFDLQSAQAQVKAAEKALGAAKAERLPTLAVAADYGAIGINPSNSHGTFSVAGSLRIPVFEGGRVGGSIQQAQAALDQRKAEVADLRGRIAADVRVALLDIQAAEDQVKLAQDNLEVSRKNLELTRQRLEEGITNTVEVVQAQEAVSSADLDLITALFAHNLAKATLARSLGKANAGLDQFLSLPKIP